MKSSTRHLRIFLIVVFTILLFTSVAPRIERTYLEDDFLWMAPLTEQITEKYSVVDSLKKFLTQEMTFTDGVWTAIFLSLFKYNFSAYVWCALILHLLNAFLFYKLLRTMNFSSTISFWAGIIYLYYYGHIHAYLWTVASHHIVVAFFFFAILILYLEIAKRVQDKLPYECHFALLGVCCVLATWQRISILFLPIIILIHLLYTSSSKRVLLKLYDLWMILTVILSSYFLIALNHGFVSQSLKGLDIYETIASIKKLSFGFTLFGLILFLLLLRYVIHYFYKGSIKNPYTKIINGAAWIVVFFPQLLFITMHQFAAPFISALTHNPFDRWQTFIYEPHYVFDYARWSIASVCIFLVIMFMRRHNKHLIIFLCWYALSIPYLSDRLHAMPSKYLIYISPFMSITIVILLFDVIAGKIKKHRKFYEKGIKIALVILIATNIVFMRVRLQNTLLADYHWSYDYIRMAHGVKDYLNAKNKTDDQALCFTDIEDIPFRVGWRHWILWIFDFSRLDPFRLTLHSVIGTSRNVYVNEDCPADAIRFKLDKTLLVDEDDLPIEPFFAHYTKGMEALNNNQLDQAYYDFSQAAHIKPFLLRFVTDEPAAPLFYRNFFAKQAKKSIYRMYTKHTSKEEKIILIDSMIREEAISYGTTLNLLSYFEHGIGQEDRALRLKKDAQLVIKPKNLEPFLVNGLNNSDLVKKIRSYWGM